MYALGKGEKEYSPIGVGYKSQTKKLFVKEFVSPLTNERFFWL